MNRRRRPSRSATRPPSSRKPPNTSTYALTTHDRSSCENSRSFPIEGSATLTIDASSTTTNWAAASSASATHLLVLLGDMQRSSHDFVLRPYYNSTGIMQWWDASWAHPIGWQGADLAAAPTDDREQYDERFAMR